MSIFTDNKDFYITPEWLIKKMYRKTNRFSYHGYALDPCAGNGAISEYMAEKCRNLHVIENDINFQPILREDFYLVDYDFLTYHSHTQYDLIIGNAPFSLGLEFLNKAIQMTYDGEIVLLINAETIKNPCNLPRMALVEQLTGLKADIEFISGAFDNSERKTGVEVALIYIDISPEEEKEDLFDGANKNDASRDADNIPYDDIEGQGELSTKDPITDMVDAYNRTVKVNINTIIDFYKNSKYTSNYLTLKIFSKKDDRFNNGSGDPIKEKVNFVVETIRHDYWMELLETGKVRKYLTKKKKDVFMNQLKKNARMEFTENNIKSFLINLINGFEETLNDAIEDLFDRMTSHHYNDDDLFNKNVHMYSGWKTNNCFKVNKKVIIPYYYANSGTGFWNKQTNWQGGGWKGAWQVRYAIVDELRDIDLVMSYFDGQKEYIGIVEALEKAIESDTTRNVESTYFNITIYKKGTIHLTWRDKDILRRFNIAAGKKKEWLHQDYGMKKFDMLSESEKDLVNNFESKKEYKDNMFSSLLSFNSKSLFLIE